MMMYTVIPVHYIALGLTPMQVGVLLSANRWVRMVTNHLAERATRHFPPLVLMVAALAGAAATTGVYGLTSPFLFFLLARLAWGMCWSLLRQIGVMNAVEGAAADRVGRMLGVYNGVVRIGFVAGTFAGGLFFDALGYRSAFLLMAGLSLAGIIPAVLGIGGRRRLEVPTGDGLPITRSRTEDWLTYARGFLIGAVGSGIVMSTLGHVLNERIAGGLSLGGVVIGVATINGVLLAVRNTFQIFGSPFLGALIDRMGVFRSQLLLFSLATGALFLAFLRLPLVAVVLLVVIFFLSETALHLGLTIQAGIRGSKRYAYLATAMDMGSATGPVVGWTAVGMLLSSRWTFLIGGAFYFLGTVLTVATMRSKAAGGAAPPPSSE
jgi:predicted MFS family arabinose efflux permease